MTAPAAAGLPSAGAVPELAPGAPARPEARPSRRRVDVFPYLLLLPAAAMMVLVNLLPIIEGLRMSMLKPCWSALPPHGRTWESERDSRCRAPVVHPVSETARKRPSFDASP